MSLPWLPSNNLIPHKRSALSILLWVVFLTQSFTECAFPLLSEVFVCCGEKKHKVSLSGTSVIDNEPQAKRARWESWFSNNPKHTHFIFS